MGAQNRLHPGRAFTSATVPGTYRIIDSISTEAAIPLLTLTLKTLKT
jgi:hypothetical protein